MGAKQRHLCSLLSGLSQGWRNVALNGGQLLHAIGWTVIGHDWHLYIASKGTLEEQDIIVSKLVLVLLWLQANLLAYRRPY